MKNMIDATKSKSFIYCLIVNSKIEWTEKEEENIAFLGESKKEQQQISEFIVMAEPGDFISLENGSLIFCTKATTEEKNRIPKPRPLFEVLDEAGLLEE